MSDTHGTVAPWLSSSHLSHHPTLPPHGMYSEQSTLHHRTPATAAIDIASRKSILVADRPQEWIMVRRTSFARALTDTFSSTLITLSIIDPRVRQTPLRTLTVIGFAMAFGVALACAVVVRKQVEALQAVLPKAG